MQLPRKNSRQWKTVVALVKALSNKAWIDDAGFGHAEFIDDISRLRKKGWRIIDKPNADLFSTSYGLNPIFWNNVKDTEKALFTE